jgi:hypothetical protein
MIIRKIFYKVLLTLDNGQVLPVTVATSDLNKLPSLVERHKMLYLARGFNIQGFQIEDTRYTIQMSEQQYENELAYCDIIDDDGGYATGPAQIVRTIKPFDGND